MTATGPVTTTCGYDGDGEQTSVTDASGNTTSTRYDHLGRAVSSTLPPVALWTGTTTVDDSVQGSGPNQIAYSLPAANWTHCAPCAQPNPYYNGSVSYDHVANDTATVAFTGQGILLYVQESPGTGIAAVAVDNGPETLLDTYSPSLKGNQLLWSSPALASGTHTLRVRVTGTKNARATDSSVGLDRVDIVPTLSTASTAYDGEGNTVASTTARVGLPPRPRNTCRVHGSTAT